MSLQPTTGRKIEQQPLVAVASWEGVHEFNYRSFKLSLKTDTASPEAPVKLHIEIGEGRRPQVPNSQAQTKEFDIAEGLLFIAETATSRLPANPILQSNGVAQFGQGECTRERDFLSTIDENGKAIKVDSEKFILALRPSFVIYRSAADEFTISPTKRTVQDGNIYEFLLHKRLTPEGSIHSLNTEKLITIADAEKLFKHFVEATLSSPPNR